MGLNGTLGVRPGCAHAEATAMTLADADDSLNAMLGHWLDEPSPVRSLVKGRAVNFSAVQQTVMVRPCRALTLCSLVGPCTLSALKRCSLCVYAAGLAPTSA